VTRRPFPLPVPLELRPYILDFHWAVAVLHRLDLPTAHVPLADLYSTGAPPYETSLPSGS